MGKEQLTPDQSQGYNPFGETVSSAAFSHEKLRTRKDIFGSLSLPYLPYSGISLPYLS